MLPAFKAGVILLGAAKYLVKPKVGLPAVVKRDDLLMIKRIKKIDSNGIWVEGDNISASGDSRNFGYIKPKNIQAVIFMRVR